MDVSAGTYFTCFTGTKVQILTHLVDAGPPDSGEEEDKDDADGVDDSTEIESVCVCERERECVCHGCLFVCVCLCGRVTSINKIYVKYASSSLHY
jgi:hypothetical protein